jgi:ATP-dependent Lon protease
MEKYLFRKRHKHIHDNTTNTINTMPKREISSRGRKKKVVESSSSESETDSDSEYKPSEESWVTASESGEEEEEFDHKKLKKTLAKLFPSKYTKKRAEESDSEEEEAAESPKKSKKSKHAKKSKPVVYSESESESEEEEPVKKNKKSKHKKLVSESEEEEESEDEEKESKFNIVFTIGGGEDDAEYYDDEDDSGAEHLIEDENEECNSEDEKTFMREKYEKVEKVPQEGAASPEKKKKKDKKKSAVKKPVEPEPEKNDAEKEYLELLDLKKLLVDQMSKRPKNKIIANSLKECKESIKKLVRKARHANTTEYHKLIHNDQRQANEIEYFKKKLSNKEQLTVMEDLKEINDHIYVEKPYRLALLQSKMPPKFKAVAMQKLNTLKSMDPSDHEYYKIKNWVDNFMRIPFGVYRNIEVKMSDGLEVCDTFLKNARSTLDTCVYGLNDAKMQIMQMMGQWIVNPNSVGSAIAIHGPPGTGKTSIVKDGISKIMGRDFTFIALGGCGDSSFLEGHSYTYEGSTWGKIAQTVMDSKSMNPVIYFDELDKVSDTARGQEIIGILTHLTDSTQNSEFHDKYFSEVTLDLSKCLFIFSYNDEAAVNPILKDRMYRIQTKGYESSEKVTIARDYLLPKIREQVNFSAEDIVIPDETLKYIIGAQHLTKGESGVRNLKRCLEIIYTKLNLFRLIKSDNTMFEKELGLKVTFPITVTKKEVDIFIKNSEPINPTLWAMYT